MPSIPIGLQSYDDGFESLTVERHINCYTEQAPQSATSVVPVLGTPGLIRAATVGNGPIRAAVRHDGSNFIVSGNEVYRMEDNFSAIKLGDVPGTGNASVTDIERGVAFCVGGQYNTTRGSNWDTPTLPEWEGFDDTPESVTSINNTIIIGFKGNDYYCWGGANQLNTFNAIDVARAERKTDETVRVWSDNNELLLLGTKSIEVKYDAQVATGRWRSSGSGLVERGLAAFGSVVTQDNTTLWLGNDLIVYRLNGRTPQRISNHWLERQIQKIAVVSDAHAFAHTFNGHKLYTLTFPSADRSFVLDLNTGLAHERRSWGRDYYQGWVAIEGGSNTPLVGSAFDGGIYRQSDEELQEDGGFIERVIRTPYVHTDDGDPFSVDMLEIVLDTGREGPPLDTSEAKVMLRYTDDGRLWSSERQASLGEVGQYGVKVRWFQLGQTETGRRAFEFRLTAPVPWRVVKARAEIDIGQ